MAKQHVQPGTAIPQFLDEKEALKLSQDAIGNKLGNYSFLNHSGRTVRLSDYLGKPLIINMIYTHCPVVCAAKSRNLEVLKQSRDVLGGDSFGVLTIGFDTENDTPEEMDAFSKRINVKIDNWEFVSANRDTIKKLSKELGFIFVPSPLGGFDHITQTTLIDRQGRVHQQIYGDDFNNQTLLDPLKNLVFNIKTTDAIYNIDTAESGFAGVAKSVQIFCTIYDTKTGKYVVDYSIFYAFGWSVFISMLIIWWIIREYRRSPKRSRQNHA